MEASNNMKKIITYGTFDLLHYGHYNLLKRAKSLGDYLIVGVSSDEMCHEKNKRPYYDQITRMRMIADWRFVDEVILEKNMVQKVYDVKNMGVSCFVLGSDYKTVFPKMPEYQILLELGCEVIFLERTPYISTTQLKRELHYSN